MSFPSIDPRLYKKYKVVICPKCGRVQAVMAVKRFKCRFCGHSRPMHEMRIYYATDDGRKVPEAVKIITELKVRGELR